MAALLRSILRRNVVTAPLSVLAGHAQPSWGSSYTGQNYASLCRAFGSKPVVNDILGTGLGSNNTSNPIRELAGNAQPSWGSSYTGQNYASLCRAFGSKPVVNVILGKAKIDAGEHMSGGSDQGYKKMKNKALEYLKILVVWLLDLLHDLYQQLRARVVAGIAAWILWYDWRRGKVHDIKTIQCIMLGLEVKKLQEKLDDVQLQLDDVQLQLDNVKGDLKSSKSRGFFWFFKSP